VLRSSLALTGIAAVMLTGTGCPNAYDGTSDRPMVDSGPPPDAGPRPGADTDGDGLCDLTEIRLGTNPAAADTDGDGFPDWVESANHSDGVSPADPPRETIVVLSEVAGGSASYGVQALVSGSGETYMADFYAGLADDPYGTMADAFYSGSQAVDASPRGNVGAIDTAHGRFAGVVGTTRLFYSVGFAYDAVAQPPRLCMRMYDFFFRVMTDTGSYVYAAKSYLLIVPPGMTMATGAWCLPPTPCE
jgi:hypothetical protein